MSEESGASIDAAFVERVTRVVLERFPDFAAFEQRMGWMPGFFENDVLKAEMPKERIADQVVESLHCERNWLLTGEGEPWKRKAPKAPEQPEELPDGASPIVTTVRSAADVRKSLPTSLKDIVVGPTASSSGNDENGSGNHATATADAPADWGQTEVISRGSTNKPEKAAGDDADGDGTGDGAARPAAGGDDPFNMTIKPKDTAGEAAAKPKKGDQAADDFFDSFTVAPDQKKSEAGGSPAAAGGDDPFSMTIAPKKSEDADVPSTGDTRSRGSSAGESIVIGAIDIDGLDNADRALQRAQQQQIAMLKPPPDWEAHGLEFATRFKPAHGVASEFYDFIEIDEHRVALVVFDVAGHVGLNVWGDVTMSTRAFRIYSKALQSPREILVKTNTDLVPDLMAESSLTVCVTLLDIENRTITVAQSGHPPLLLYNQYRSPVLEAVKPSGMVLGLVAGAKFDDLLEERTIELKAGDVLLWYTEGLINTENAAGQQLGVDSLGLMLQGESRRSPEEFLDFLFEQLDQWRGDDEQVGDCTAIVMKVGMPPGLA